MIVVTAATRWECRPLAKALGLSSNGHPGAFLGRGPSVLLIETGIGGKNTLSSLGRLVPSDAVLSAGISSGFAGALRDGVRTGDIVADLSAAPAAFESAARRAADAAGLGLHLGPVVTSPRVVTDPAEKRRLGRERGALAVDMESGTVRGWASSRRVPYAALRAVLDEVDQPLPAEVPEGDSAAALSRYLLGNWRRIPSLVRLGLQQRKAARSLGAFLRHFLSETAEHEEHA